MVVTSMEVNGEWSNSKCMLKDKGINLSEVMKLIKG